MATEDRAEDPVHELRSSWVFGRHISTLPRWVHTQVDPLRDTARSLPDIDADTRSTVIRQLLFTLRCHGCERKLTNQCNFSICVRGLMAGVSGIR